VARVSASEQKTLGKMVELDDGTKRALSPLPTIF
jgi:hypothetical protein